MGVCDGFGDWLKCLRCSNLCSSMCPLEGKDVVEEFRKRMLSEDVNAIYSENGFNNSRGNF